MILKVQVWIHRRVGERFEVLLLRTVPERGSNWQPVTGSADEGETLAAAALREAEEETGWKFDRSQLRDLDLEFEFDGRWGRAREAVFALEVPAHQVAPKLDPSEHTEWKWVGAVEALDLLPAFESQRKPLRRLIEVS